MLSKLSLGVSVVVCRGVRFGELCQRHANAKKKTLDTPMGQQ